MTGPMMVASSPVRSLATLMLACLAAGSAASCSDDERKNPLSGPPRIAISEIMYHPVGEATPQEQHEFVEIHNPGTTAVALGGWSLSGGIRYRFPDEVSLAPGQYLVIAKNRAKLLALSHYRLSSEQVLGDYDGELDNDGERLALLDARAQPVDEVIYDDRFPWPVGADALGAGDRWLSPRHLGGQPLPAHQYLGRSLERMSFADPSALVANWAASPLDGATPGRPNSDSVRASGAVQSIDVKAPRAAATTILAADRPVVRVQFSGGPPLAAEIEFFADDLELGDEPTTKVALKAGADGHYEASLPPQKDNTIVRYRILGDRGSGTEALSPRPGDPNDWHAYFVSPLIEGKTPVYHLFISKRNWETMWDYIEQGRVPGHVSTLGGRPGYCTPNPLWNERVPAVLVAEGRVYDVQTRYQGSSVNRTGGTRPIPVMDPMVWPAGAVTPSRPSPLRPLSLRVAFPRYNRLDKKSAFNLNKLSDGACLGFSYGVAVSLFEQAGIAAGETPRYVRLYVNGGYYNYVQRMERVDEELIRRFYGDDRAMGDLFKSTGIRWEQGPYDWGDQRLLQPHCGYTAEERYAHTYERQSLEDYKQGSNEVKKLIEDLHAARAAGLPAMRKFIEDNFDVPHLMTYMAIRNWMAPWDDYFHNHYLYRRADSEGGRWTLIPNDFDGEMLNSGFSTANSSFFNGRENDRSNRNNWMNYLKDTYLQTFREEHIARLKELSQSVLHPANVAAVVDHIAGRYDVAEAKASAGVKLMPMLPMCSFGDAPMVAERIKNFARRRHERILDGLFE